MKAIIYSLGGLAAILTAASRKSGSSLKRMPGYAWEEEQSTKPEFYIEIEDRSSLSELGATLVDRAYKWRECPLRFIFGPFSLEEAEQAITEMTEILKKCLITHKPFRPESRLSDHPMGEPWLTLATGVRKNCKGASLDTEVTLSASILPSRGYWNSYISLINDFWDARGNVSWAMYIWERNPNLKRIHGKPEFEVQQPRDEKGRKIPILSRAEWYSPGWQNKMSAATRHFIRFPTFISDRLGSRAVQLGSNQQLMKQIRAVLTPDLLKKEYKNQPHKLTGHCYAASQALYHMVGGKRAGWHPVHAKDQKGVTHWWLEDSRGRRLDPTAAQYLDLGRKPPYKNGVSGGFLTTKPSKRAKEIIRRVRKK